MDIWNILNIISQVCIVIFGVMAILLLNLQKRSGVIFGLISQPFWYYSAYYTKNWGIFILSFAYTASYCLGYYTQFIKVKEKDDATKD
jgi:hypothetical protein